MFPLTLAPYTNVMFDVVKFEDNFGKFRQNKKLSSNQCESWKLGELDIPTANDSPTIDEIPDSVLYELYKRESPLKKRVERWWKHKL